MVRINEEDRWRSDEVQRKSCVCHLNSLSSLSYSVIALGLSTYIIAAEVLRYCEYINTPFPEHSLSYLQINIHIGLVGVAAVLIPFFYCCAIFKIGNFANDGYSLGTHDGVCSKDPPPIPAPSTSFFKHTGPTAPILHLAISHALLMAKMVREAAAVQDNSGPQDNAWRSELSSFLPDKERLEIVWKLLNQGFSAQQAWPRQDYLPTDDAGLYTTPDLILTGTPVTPAPSFPHDLGGDDSNLTIRGKDWDEMWHVRGIAWGPVSPHLINYIIAHVVYAGRYAGVFWGTNKCFGLLMFIQLLINALHNIFVLNGYTVLHKVRSVSPDRLLVDLKGFLLTVPVTAAVFTATQVLVTLSSCVIYHYGWTKFQHFIASEKEKYHIMSKHGYKLRCEYLPHTLALIWLVLMTLSTVPLLHDWVVVYNASLDTAVLSATLACLLHILIWILLWIFLTIKSWWVFKVRVQISHATVAGPHSIRLVNEVQLSGQLEGPNSPLLVVGAGKTYFIHDQDPKRALMKTVMAAVAEKKAAGREDEIYWVLPQPVLQKKEQQQQQQQQQQKNNKVTFTSDTVNASSGNKNKSKKKRSGDRSNDASDSDMTNESDGDYARLRDVSFPGPTQRLINANRSDGSCQEQQQPQHNHQETLPKDGDTTSRDAPDSGADFPDPPPEVTGSLVHYPSPPTPPPPLPPLPEEDLRQKRSSTHSHHHGSPQRNSTTVQQLSSPLQEQHYQQNRTHNQQSQYQHLPLQRQQPQHLGQQHQLQQYPQQSQDKLAKDMSPPLLTASHPKIKIVKGDSLDTSTVENSDCASPASSGTPPDKRCDSGIHSQGSTSSSTGTHSKSGSSGSEDCVPTQPPPMQPLHIESVGLHSVLSANHNHHLPAPTEPPPSIPRCSSVDDLCTGSNSPPPPAPTSAKTMSLQRNYYPISDDKSRKINIEVVGGGYGFLPPSKFVSSEPIYSDASTPVVIRRRSSITAVEPDTPAYERSAGSFSTFAEPLPALPSLPRCLTRGNSGGSHMLAATNPFPGSSRSGGIYGRGLNLQRVENKHATIAGTGSGSNNIIGFHLPDQVDPRYFSVPSARAPAGELLSKFKSNLPYTGE